MIIHRVSHILTQNCNRPIVHRAGGMLLQSNKEFALCGDLRPDDVFFYYTTTLVNFIVAPCLSFLTTIHILSLGDG